MCPGPSVNRVVRRASGSSVISVCDVTERFVLDVLASITKWLLLSVTRVIDVVVLSSLEMLVNQSEGESL